MPVSAERVELLRMAYRLEEITVVWLLVEIGVALTAGIIAHSLLLLAFGIDSVIELVSAGVLIWRLSAEITRGMEIPPIVESRASRIAGVLLLALAIYVVVSSVWALVRHQGAEFSPSGLAVSVVAIPVMCVLSRRKLTLAEKLESRALRADAVESIACAWLALVVCVGLLAQFLSGVWWVDPVAALAIVYFVVKEGLEAWEGDHSDDQP